MAFIHQSSNLSVFARTNTPYKEVSLSPSIYQVPINTFSASTTSRSFHLKQSSTPLKAYGSISSHLPSIHAEELENDMIRTNLVQQVRRLVVEANDDRFEDLIMVNALQRLAIDHHFKEEINSILRKRYMQFTNTDSFSHLNLYEVSLCFRILRQNGFPLSTDAFMKFKANNDSFDVKWNNDIRGLMELYEASQLSIQGEIILDEAQKFSRERLEENLKYLDDDQARMVRRTLKNPYHKTIPFINFKNYINDFKGTVMHELAEMDFNMMQTIHQMELNEISRWWSELGLSQDLTRARNEPLKWYICSMAALTTNPKLSTERINLTKYIAFNYIIDDIFDIYGTTEELTKFAEAIDRWDRNATQQLPSYLQSTFKANYDFTTEIADRICEEHGFNPINSLRKALAALCNAFLEEAKWFASGKTPKAEEYLKMGIASSGIRSLFVHVYFLLGDGRNEEQACIIDDDNNKIIESVSRISRLTDDLAMTEESLHDNNDGSYLKCYLKEYQGCCVEIAQEHVLSLISDGWKQLNKECLSRNHYSANFLKAACNYARMVPYMTSYGDADSLAILKDYIKALLLDTRVSNSIPF